VQTSTRWLIGIGAAIAVIVVTSVVLAVTLGDGEQEYAPGTPEAAVQTYFRAIQDGDATSAFALFSEDLAARCQLDELRRLATEQPDFSVRIRDTTMRDGAAEIGVRIAIEGGESPFGNGYDLERVMVLAEESGEWRITEPPWPLWSCRVLP